MGKNEIYELEALLYEIDHKGYVIIPLAKLYRLLSKGNRSPGTWKALLDVWEEMNGRRTRADLYIFESSQEELVISKFPGQSIQNWASES